MKQPPKPSYKELRIQAMEMSVTLTRVQEQLGYAKDIITLQNAAVEEVIRKLAEGGVKI